MASGLRRRAFIVCGGVSQFIGNGHPDFIGKKHPKYGKETNPTFRQLLTETGRHALRHHNGFEVPPELVEKLWVSNFAGELYCNQGHMGACVADIHPALQFKPSMRVEGACASGGLAFACGITAIEAGMDIGFVVGAECQNTVSAREGGNFLARAADYARQRPLDEFTFPALFAIRMKAYLTAHKLTLSDIAHTSAKAFANAKRNPKAHMHVNKMTHELCDKSPFFLGNPDLKPWLRLSDSSLVSDGAAGIVIASEEGLAKLGLKTTDCPEVLACEVTAGNLYVDGDPLVFEASKVASGRAYAKTGLSAKDMDMAEVHDCFTIAECLMLEALGIVPQGKGGVAAKEGITVREGRTPCNPGGGLVAGGHPVGATGIKQLLQSAKQMFGIAPGYQLPKPTRFAITANMGGDDKTSVVCILKNPKL